MLRRPTDNSEPVRAGIYCRMSLASMNDTTKVDDQERIGRNLAATLGWQVANGCGHPFPNGVYTDNNRSAWQHNRKRGAWDQMLKDIEAGKINAIIVYHGDRLTRQPMDLEILIALSRTRGIKLASPTGVRDLNNDDDQFTLGIEANVYRKESASTSRRRKQQYERWRRDGRVRTGGPGGRSYGFETDGLTHLEAECELIREMGRRILAGESAGMIARDLNARGARTVKGNLFKHSTVRDLLSNPRYAGLMPGGESDAAWKPVLERETWEQVRVALAASAARFGPGSNARKYQLSGIAACGVCGTGLQVHRSAGGRPSLQYACEECGKVRRSLAHLDAYVSAVVVARLGNPGNPQGEMPAPDHAPEWASLARERAETEELLGDYTASAGRAPLLMRRLDAIDARMAELRELAGASSRDLLLSQYRGISLEEFKGLPLDVRRALVAATVTVAVLPASKKGPGFRPEDVRVVPVQ
jgi:site-specific DNA recombinase